ncbi:MAG TPA: alpha/beta fold hydrolase, partial [Phenylobacterium sp.]|nr:alpha/beta fold hydrolase [Phenylobacterium sp.]
FTSPPHIGAGPIAKPRQITHDNDALGGQVSARSITWKSEGFDVQGWLTGPLNPEPGKKYPMIVLVHGGPSSAVQPGYMWKGTTNDLVQHGFFVFQANPRGSFGQGEAFTRANVKDFGGGDLRDILAGVDAVEKVAPVDDRRLGVYGHSYGGFMSMWVVTHSQRFKAAVAGAGIANWVSYYGQNGIDQWMVPFFGSTMYDDPSVYDRLSPIRSIKNAKTPTFIYVGERDVECPPAQSLEFHHGLDAMGVPNSLVIYAGEGHGIRDADHKIDLKTRILGWFDHYLGQP